MKCDTCFYLVYTLKESAAGLPKSAHRCCFSDRNEYEYDLDDVEDKAKDDCEYYEEGDKDSFTENRGSFTFLQLKRA